MTILMEIQMIKGGLQTDHLVFEERKKLFRGNSFLNIPSGGPPEGNWWQLPHLKKLTRS